MTEPSGIEAAAKDRSGSDLIDAFIARPLEFIPKIGDCICIVLTPNERDEVLRALRPAASLPGLDEEAIRKDERERCAKIAVRCIPDGITANPFMAAERHGEAIAAAIRSRAALQQQEGRE